MNWKRLAAAAVLAFTAIPAEAWDYREQDQPYTYVFMRIPLDGRSTKEQTAVWGLAVRGKKDYQAFTLDTQMMTRFTQLGFIESKLLIVGAVAAAGVVAVAASGASSAATQQAQQQQAQQAAVAARTSPTATGTSPTGTGTSPTGTGTSPTGTSPTTSCPKTPAC